MSNTQNVFTNEVLDADQWIFFWDDYMGESNR
jgi:hypothetical protein